MMNLLEIENKTRIWWIKRWKTELQEQWNVIPKVPHKLGVFEPCSNQSSWSSSEKWRRTVSEDERNERRWRIIYDMWKCVLFGEW